MTDAKCSICLLAILPSEDSILCVELDLLCHRNCTAYSSSRVRSHSKRELATLSLDRDDSAAASFSNTTSTSTFAVSKKRLASPSQLSPPGARKQRCSSFSSLSLPLVNLFEPANASTQPSTEPSTSSLTASETMWEVKPDWFVQFEATAAQRHNEICHNHTTLCSKVDVIGQELTAHNRLASLTDEPELLVTGLPPEFLGSLYDAAVLVLRALGFGHGHDIPSILETREWTSHPGNPRSSNSPPRMNRGENTSSNRVSMRSFVFNVGATLTNGAVISPGGQTDGSIPLASSRPASTEMQI